MPRFATGQTMRTADGGPGSRSGTRHRDHDPFEMRDDLDADDLRAADLQTGELPGTLTELSPWLDLQPTPSREMFARLTAQQHRRFIKSHTPLDGLPFDPRATYIVVARHPLDMAVSADHQGSNLDRARLRQLTGQPEPSEPPPPRPPLHDWLISWIHEDTTPQQQMDSLPGVMWHLADAWARRDQPNIVLVHYQDLSADLDGEMRRLAGRLGICVPPEVWPSLVQAATFQHMRDNAERLTGPPVIIKDAKVFVLLPYLRGLPARSFAPLNWPATRRRAAQLAPPELLGLASPGRSRRSVTRRWTRPGARQGLAGRVGPA